MGAPHVLCLHNALHNAISHSVGWCISCHLPRRPQEVEEKTSAPTQKWPIRSLFLHHSATATNTMLPSDTGNNSHKTLTVSERSSLLPFLTAHQHTISHSVSTCTERHRWYECEWTCIQYTLCLYLPPPMDNTGCCDYKLSNHITCVSVAVNILQSRRYHGVSD